jgi:hypothetical protein
MASAVGRRIAEQPGRKAAKGKRAGDWKKEGRAATNCPQDHPDLE